MVPLDPYLFDLLHQVLLRQVPLLPASLSEVQTLLDVGCGSLPWSKGMVQALSQQRDRGVLDRLRIDSLEITPVVVRAGEQYSRASRGHIVVCAEEVWHLPATLKGHYDLVHAHLLSPYLAPWDWPNWCACASQADGSSGMSRTCRNERQPPRPGTACSPGSSRALSSREEAWASVSRWSLS